MKEFRFWGFAITFILGFVAGMLVLQAENIRLREENAALRKK